MKVVEQALAVGHQVVAFARDPQKMPLNNPSLTVVQGDVLDADVVNNSLQGVEAVIVTLGGKPDTSVTVLTDGTQNIVNAMQSRNIKRLIVESSYAMSGSDQSMQFLKQINPEDKIAAMMPMIDDKKGQTKAIESSNLDWTIVMPSFLTDGEKVGNYRVGDNLEISPENNISRADVADFLLKQLTDTAWNKKSVTISY